jgi:hypothetical protein
MAQLEILTETTTLKVAALVVLVFGEAAELAAVFGPVTRLAAYTDPVVVVATELPTAQAVLEQMV